VRGGGGNFGVVASFEYRLHPVGPTIMGGLIAWPFERARDVLRFYREVTASASDELMLVAGLIHAGDGSGVKLAAMAAGHCGPLDAGAKVMASIKAFGAPALDAIGPMSYCRLNTLLDAAYPRGALNHWKSSFLAQLSDDAIDTMIECFARCPTPMGQLLLEHFHGAVTRVGVGDTAFAHRAAGYNFVALSEWMDPAITDRCVAWARDSFAGMQPYMGTGRYLNYLDASDEKGDAVAAAYGPNYKRLREVKAKYDPDNFFHMNQNIRPSS
jgi:FAD/FMN-containing dehydrogenase